MTEKPSSTEHTSLLNDAQDEHYGSAQSTSDDQEVATSTTTLKAGSSSSNTSSTNSSTCGKDDDDVESSSLHGLSQSLLQCDNDEDVRMLIKNTMDISLHQFRESDSSGVMMKQSGGSLVRQQSQSIDEEDIQHRSSYQKVSLQEVSESSIIMQGQGGEDPLHMNRAKQRGVALKISAIASLTLLGVLGICAFFVIGNIVVGPPSQPVGPYKLVQLQEGSDFFSHYTFYDGLDSEGSKGYVNYVSRQKAFDLNIANVSYESISETDVYGSTSRNSDSFNATASNTKSSHVGDKTEPFIYMSTSPTAEGPRDSIRLEGLKRFNRGLFIIDIRHMPAGCGSWPAFWLTDEANWPVNGEFDIVEGVNTQCVAKTALHSTRNCMMDDIPLGVKTGVWDTAQGVPKKNGELDMTKREARDCFVYDPHQWLNQGCVAMSERNDTLGTPLNENGGGVYALEWDPINRHIRSWVFSPHKNVPDNLRESMETASLEPHERVRPDPSQWDLPYAYFSIGDGTNCKADHFKNMHLVFNLALCGSVAGNRFFLDCPELNEKYGSCDSYIDADTPAMQELYWKIRGVYVYEREWELSWV